MGVTHTEDAWFPFIYDQGSFENLEAIRNAGVKVSYICQYIVLAGNSNAWKDHDLIFWTQCPLLCKEFIIDAWQLYYARSKGADAVLLIAAVLPDRDINYMLKICKILGMAALVEVSELFLQYVLYAEAFRLSSLAALE